MVGKVIALMVLSIIFGVVVEAIAAVFLMVGLALVHSGFPAVPALGFVASFGVLLAVGAIAWAAKGVQLEAK